MPDGARIVNVTSDAAVEAYEGWGGYGSSKAALEQLTDVLAAERPNLARLRLRPRRHEHRDAPGGVPRRGHLRPPAARGERARAALPAHGDLPSGRYRRRRPEGRRLERRSPRSSSPSASRPTRRRRRAGLARDDVRMLVARGDGRLVHARARELPDFLRPGDLVVVNTSATLPAALAARRTDGTALELRLSTPLPGAADDRWVVELRARRRALPRRARRRRARAAAAARRATLETPYLDGRAPVGRRAWSCPSRCWPTSPATARRSATATCPTPIRCRPTRPPTRPSPAAPRCRAPGARSRPRCSPRWRRGASTVAPIVLHTGVSSPERGERPYPERFRVPAATARLVDGDPRRGAGASSPSGRPSCARWRPSRAPTAASRRGRAGPRSSSPPRAACGSSTACSPAGTSPRPRTSTCSRRSPAARSSSAPTPPRCSAGYLWHEFGDVHLILP